ncbi:MAG TPA: hypothetical protein IAC41_06290 [Candidatus Merdenecus merdavium]|nr:hypothetical protein [Candidatus Merdenecus merdavium]
MKFIKILVFDIRSAVKNNYLLFLTPVFLTLVIFANFMIRISNLESINVISRGELSFGDYWMFAFGGMKEYIPSIGESFIFPIVWLLIYLLFLFIVLYYPYKDMEGIGKQILVSSSGRKIWWASKCCWIVICAFIYHFILYFFGLGLCAAMKMPLSEEVNMRFVYHIYEMFLDPEAIEEKMIPLAVYILPFIFSVSIALFQMTVSLYFKPVFGFLVSSVILLSSAYYMTPLLYGNFVIPIRHDWFIESKISPYTGIFVMIFIGLFSAFVGGFAFSKYDILNRE